MKKRCKKFLIKLLSIVCSAMLLFLSPCARYIDAKSIDKVYAIPIAPALGGEAAGAALEFLIAVFASIAAGEIVIENPESVLSPFALYVANNHGDSINDTCMNIYNKATGTIESISWGELIDSLSDAHDLTVDNLTDLYAQYCPALLESFEDFVTDVLNGSVYIDELSRYFIDVDAVTEDSIKAQRTYETYDYTFYYHHISSNGYTERIYYDTHLNFKGPIAGYIQSDFLSFLGFNVNSIIVTNITFVGKHYSRYKDDFIIYDNHNTGISFTTLGSSYYASCPIFSNREAAEAYLRTGAGYEDALNFNSAMESVIDLTKVPDLAPDIPPFTRSWQQKEWERIAKAPDIIGIGSYGHGVYNDNWGDDIPWIGLESLQDYSRSLLDIYNQIIDDILNGTYDSSEDIPGTYSEAWEQAISETWDNVEQSTDAVPGESEKDKPTDGDDEEKEDPEGGGGGSGDSNNDPKEPPEGNGNEGGIKSLYDEDGNYTGGRSKEELDELANDPAHAGSARPSDIEKGLHEREIGLDLEERGELARPIVRDPSGAAEFIDGNGQAWDVKSFHSGFSPDNGGYTLASSMKAINDSLTAGEYVILDTTYLNEADLAELLNEIFEEGLLDRIIVWP